MNESLPSQGMLPLGCGIYFTLEGPPPSSATELKSLLIFLAIISIVTFLVSTALYALVVTEVKTINPE